MKLPVYRMAALAVVATLGIAATPVRKIQFTDTSSRTGCG